MQRCDPFDNLKPPASAENFIGGIFRIFELNKRFYPEVNDICRQKLQQGTNAYVCLEVWEFTKAEAPRKALPEDAFKPHEAIERRYTL